ncbi:MAG: hypothetical protein IT330_11035 [Anaerolineae bacterium]|nr:hypothetical protein [Anaerolineae bacterium]
MNWQSYEPIELIAKRFGFFPAVFGWRGQEFQVEAVEECRTVMAGWLPPWRKEVRFRVRTSAGTFELAQDIQRDLWHVCAPESAIPGLVAASRPRYPLPFHRRRAFRLLRKALSRMRTRRARVYKRGFVLSGKGAV